MNLFCPSILQLIRYPRLYLGTTVKYRPTTEQRHGAKITNALQMGTRGRKKRERPHSHCGGGVIADKRGNIFLHSPKLPKPTLWMKSADRPPNVELQLRLYHLMKLLCCES